MCKFTWNGQADIDLCRVASPHMIPTVEHVDLQLIIYCLFISQAEPYWEQKTIPTKSIWPYSATPTSLGLTEIQYVLNEVE